MTVDNRLLLIAAGLATGALWTAVIAVKRARRSDVLGGLRNGLLLSAALSAVTAVIVAIAFAGQADVVTVALTVGLVLGGSYLWFGAAVMPIGFLAGGDSDWARYGTWAAVVVIVFSLGIGYVAYNAFQEGPATPVSSPTPTSTGSAGDGNRL